MMGGQNFMKRNVLESWLLLLYFDGLMRYRGFQHVRRAVREQKIRHKTGRSEEAGDLSHAVDLACVLYFKRVLCLQRSAALAVLLRRHGWSAEMVIGAQLFPFLSHAWVETEGLIVNDKPHVTQLFQVLERC
jgi:hypothetical protein